ncbi:MAG: hypothetical protein KAQ67_08505 [Gammaproteobacteria bacterium]|nr:hypothetical protein [Gammaproteobacteria bacterium]
MQNTPNNDIDTPELNKAAISLDENKPSSINGYGITTDQFHTLLTADQQNSYQNSFDKALRKQQQLFTICNTLERQNTLLHELEDLLNSEKGILWLDSQIKQFKTYCPPAILRQLFKPTNFTSKKIENSEIINLNFLSLINEIFYIPLNALVKIKTGEMTECERNEWYQWCLKIDQQLVMFKVQLKSALTFFSTKSFDKICDLAKDVATEQQLGNMKHLFQQKTSSVEDVG